MNAFIIKTLSQTGREEENYLNTAKVNKWKREATVSVVLNGERLKVFPLTPGIRQGHSLSPLLLNIVLEVQARAIRHEEEVKGASKVGEKKVKLSLFADDMVFHVENPKDSTKNCYN